MQMLSESFPDINGKVYALRQFQAMGSGSDLPQRFKYTATFYTVHDGRVYVLGAEAGQKTPVNWLGSLADQAFACIGDYDPTRAYPVVERTFDYGFIQDHILPLRP